MLVSLYSPVSWIRYILVPMTRIELSGSNGGIWSEENFLRLRKMAQPAIGGVRTTEDEGNMLETPSDDDEITIPSQEREDLRKVDIREEQLENTQEDWLLPTEPRHGARPRQTGVEATEDSMFGEATQLPSAMRHRNGNLRLSPGRRIDMEEDVFTPPRGGGGRLAPEPHGVQKEARAVPKIFLEDITRDGGQDQKNVRSPIETLVNTVSHMQRDLAILLEEYCALRTPATSQVIQAPRRVALMTTKVPQFDGTTSWEQYHQVFEAIVRSNGWDNDTAALQLFSHLEGDTLNVAHLVPLTTAITIRTGRRINSPLWFSGSAGRL